MWNKLLNLFGLGDPGYVTVGAARKRMEADHFDPRRRVVWGILATSWGADPAYTGEDATTAVRDWYGIKSNEQLDERVRAYLQGGFSTPGYDVFRAAFLARAGRAGEMLSEERSWELAFEAARVMQRSYVSWDQYGMGYLEGHLQYRAKQGDSPERLAEIRLAKLADMARLPTDAWSVPFGTSMS